MFYDWLDGFHAESRLPGQHTLPGDSIEADDYADPGRVPRQETGWVNYLYSQGYAIVNYSRIRSARGHPTLREQRFFFSGEDTSYHQSHSIELYGAGSARLDRRTIFEDSTLFISGNRILEFDRTNRQFPRDDKGGKR